MRLSELLGTRVLTATGEDLGRVLDVVTVQDGPIVDGFGALPRVEKLHVGRRPLAARLGYDRRDVKGPLPLKLFFTWRERGNLDVAWSDVESVDQGVVRVRPEWRRPAARR